MTRMWKITVLCDEEMTEVECDAIFDRVADAAHALGEQVGCSAEYVWCPDEGESS